MSNIPPNESERLQDNSEKTEGRPSSVHSVVSCSRTTWPCQPGTAKDTKHWMAPDFDAPFDDFQEYMQ